MTQPTATTVGKTRLQLPPATDPGYRIEVANNTDDDMEVRHGKRIVVLEPGQSLAAAAGTEGHPMKDDPPMWLARLDATGIVVGGWYNLVEDFPNNGKLIFQFRVEAAVHMGDVDDGDGHVSGIAVLAGIGTAVASQLQSFEKRRVLKDGRSGSMLDDIWWDETMDMESLRRVYDRMRAEA